jgi:hypothetical protein
MNETYILLFLSIPYYVDFFSGLFIFKFLAEIVELDEFRLKPQDPVHFLFKDNIFRLPDIKYFDPNDN